jgi:hypothetical protein
MEELLIDFDPSEVLAIMKKLCLFDNLKELYIFVESSLQIGVHEPFHYNLLNVIKVDLYRG